MPGPSTSEEAENAFYRAFEARDLDAMLAVWETGEDIVCIHPGGPLLHGRGAVARSFAAILSQGPALTFVVQTARRILTPDLAIHVVNEHVFEDGASHGPILTTNAYRRGSEGWRMIVHHAAPAPAPARQQYPVGPVH